MSPEEINVIHVFNYGTGIVTALPPHISHPLIDLALPVIELGGLFGKQSRFGQLFRRGELFVTVDGVTGQQREMNSTRFCSWVETIARPFRWEKSKEGEFHEKYSRMGKDLASVIMATDSFRAEVRPLRGVHTVCLPVWEKNGGDPLMMLLAPGYHEESGIYTVSEISFDAELDIDEAKKWLDELLASWPWASEKAKAVHFAALLSPFVRLLLSPQSRRLMVIYNANQPGSGKTLLAFMALVAVYGEPVMANADEDPEELRKKLETACIEGKSYFMLDDMKDLRSRAMNMLLTAGKVSARVLGKSETVEVPVEAQIFLTGNQLDVGADLARRSAVCELFFAGDPLDRTFEKTITTEGLCEPATRARLLAVLWAALRSWQANGLRPSSARPRPSFEKYTELVGAIVENFGMVNPFGMDAVLVDREGACMVALLKAAAALVVRNDKGDLEKDFRPAELLNLAQGSSGNRVGF